MNSEKIDPERNDFEKVLEIYHWAIMAGYLRVQCARCPWSFCCPVEQAGRMWCRACESKYESEK